MGDTVNLVIRSREGMPLRFKQVTVWGMGLWTFGSIYTESDFQ